MTQKRKLNTYSARITEPRSQGASQAMLIGTGLSESDLEKPEVGIASMWYEGNTCNMHLDTLVPHRGNSYLGLLEVALREAGADEHGL
ncbi:MAG TPA: hypothetical protein VFG30_06050, partial [Polyangiales bacterium]|nr:hypothetical protein [Polyangiales bacterium]